MQPAARGAERPQRPERPPRPAAARAPWASGLRSGRGRMDRTRRAGTRATDTAPEGRCPVRGPRSPSIGRGSSPTGARKRRDRRLRRARPRRPHRWANSPARRPCRHGAPATGPPLRPLSGLAPLPAAERAGAPASPRGADRRRIRDGTRAAAGAAGDAARDGYPSGGPWGAQTGARAACPKRARGRGTAPRGTRARPIILLETPRSSG
jgi:hypothetical protein